MSLSTHVLDAVAGRPAAGIAVRLFAGDDLLAEGVTDRDGRCRLTDDATGAGGGSRHGDGASSRGRSRTRTG